MKTLVLTVLSVVALAVAAPAIAQEQDGLFSNGFEFAGTCAWSHVMPSRLCPWLTLVVGEASYPEPNHALADFAVTFDFTAIEGDAYLEKTTLRGTCSDGETGFCFRMEDSLDQEYVGGVTSSTLIAHNLCPGDTPTHFIVPSGLTRRFSLVVTLDNEGGVQNIYQMQLTTVSFDGDGYDTDGDIVVTEGLADFSTPWIFVDDHDSGSLEADFSEPLVDKILREQCPDGCVVSTDLMEYEY